MCIPPIFVPTRCSHTECCPFNLLQRSEFFIYLQMDTHVHMVRRKHMNSVDVPLSCLIHTSRLSSLKRTHDRCHVKPNSFTWCHVLFVQLDDCDPRWAVSWRWRRSTAGPVAAGVENEFLPSSTLTHAVVPEMFPRLDQSSHGSLVTMRWVWV